MRFGVGMNTDHTLEEVGLQFSVTRERIRQIEAKALRKLKHPSRSKQLKSFLENLLPNNTIVTYLGRENPKLNDGGKYPECGFVGYNLNHPEIINLKNDWEQMYKTDQMFELLEWTDCSTLWHLAKKYQKEKNVLINDIGYLKGVRGHHVFINSELGLYMDHFKGKRKQGGASWRKDFKSQTLESTKNIPNLDYWKNVKP